MIPMTNHENPNGIQIKSGVKSVLAIEFIKWWRVGVAIKSHFFSCTFRRISCCKEMRFVFREKSGFKIE